jgi:hypothetical protein
MYDAKRLHQLKNADKDTDSDAEKWEVKILIDRSGLLIHQYFQSPVDFIRRLTSGDVGHQAVHFLT